MTPGPIHDPTCDMGADCTCGAGTDAEALERIGELLEEAKPGADELDEDLKKVFRLPDNGLVLD